MPPRPRPRPRPKAVGTLSSESLLYVGTPTPPLPTWSSPLVLASDDADTTKGITHVDGAKSPIAVHFNRADDDDDSYFDRSNRTKLKKLMERAAKTPEPQSDSGDETTPSSGQKRKRGVGFGKLPTLPKWTRTVNGAKVTSDINDIKPIEISSDEEQSQHSEDDEDKVVTPRQVRKKRAITPPPPVTAADLAYVKRITRENLGAKRSDNSDDELGLPSSASDEIELLPELAAISREARARSQSRALSTQPEDRTRPPLLIIVRLWPLEEGGEATLRPLRMKLNRHDPFRRAFSSISDRSGIPLEDLILTYDKKRVWGSGTPDALNIEDDRAELDAYHKVIYERLVASRDAELLNAGTPGPERAASIADGDDDSAEPVATRNPEKLHITLRSASHSTKVQVNRTSQLRKVLGHFVKTFPDAFRDKGKHARLVLDGEDLDLDEEVGTLDLEDGDMIEVKG